MRTCTVLVVAAALGALGVPAGPLVAADDAPPKAPAETVVVLGDGAARFRVVRDVKAGTITFHLTDSTVRVSSPPVVVVTTDSGPREVVLVAVEDEPGTWRLTDASARAAIFRGTMKVVVADKPYESTIALGTPEGPPAPAGTFVARHHGYVVAFPDCSVHVEAVMDRETGTVTIYSFEDVKILEAPVITVTETSGPATVTLTQVEGEPGVWHVTHEAFKTQVLSGKIRLRVNGKPCEAPLSFAPHGGTVVAVEGGPRFEVVSDATAHTYTFYALDETVDGKPVVIESPPQVVWDTPEGPRTATLVPVEREPRAWQLVGADAQLRRPGDARLRFTLFGKSLETHVGLSGFGIGVR